MSVKLRFLYGFGGRDQGKMTPDTSVERVMRMDRDRAWEVFEFDNPANTNGENYGVYPLGDNGNSQIQFLIFGGFRGTEQGGRPLFRTSVFTTDLSSFAKSKFSELDNLPERDCFSRNNYFDATNNSLL